MWRWYNTVIWSLIGGLGNLLPVLVHPTISRPLVLQSVTVVSDQIPVVEIKENVENPVHGHQQITLFKEGK